MAPNAGLTDAQIQQAMSIAGSSHSAKVSYPEILPYSCQPPSPGPRIWWGNAREQPALRRLASRVSWAQIVCALEEAKGESWSQFSQRHGDWGRDAALWLGRRRGRYRLAELGQLAGGMDYAAVGQAVSRFTRRLEQASHLRRQVLKIENTLSNVEM